MAEDVVEAYRTFDEMDEAVRHAVRERGVPALRKDFRPYGGLPLEK
jgi:hypothetical protein